MSWGPRSTTRNVRYRKACPLLPLQVSRCGSFCVHATGLLREMAWPWWWQHGLWVSQQNRSSSEIIYSFIHQKVSEFSMVVTDSRTNWFFLKAAVNISPVSSPHACCYPHPSHSAWIYQLNYTAAQQKYKKEIFNMWELKNWIYISTTVISRIYVLKCYNHKEKGKSMKPSGQVTKNM